MVQFPQKTIDEWINEDYEKLDVFMDADSMEDLRELILSFKYDDKFAFLSENIHYQTDINNYSDNNNLYLDANDVLGDFGFIFSNSHLSSVCIDSLFFVIECSCIGELRRELSNIEKEKVYYSDLGYKLTLGQENFLKIKNYEVINKTFFKKLSKIKWSSNSKNLDKYIKNFWDTITLQYDTYYHIVSSFSVCANYFACCRALTSGRLEVSNEGVIQSWLLTLNLFLMDLRPYIKDFNSASAMISDTGSEFKPINISEGQSNNKSSSIIRKVLAGVLSIIIVFLLLFAMSAILILIFGDAVDNYVDSLRPVGIIGLALAAALGKKIYDKLV
ncbi:hypothetical protein EDC42_1423 [Methanobrevibacter gottschalkii DSM 11977]|uniref:Uncharacterized protein n=1 Tax=Methanobrevibacter gottschalkii DSM 11977 TaxID=1122229 RepID=A0A3N5B5D5_9EURY|nr:hypothetical protein [Methanobrevibacter gottschalkii]RPF50770.1 hypothetical protein EDC42_1423 [Methanobrevibacter gottschalkii DSM 11977]